MISCCESNGWPEKIKKAITPILSALETICGINELLLWNLEEKMIKWDASSTLGDVLLKLTPFLKAYTTYTESYNIFLRKLSKFEKFLPFSEKLEEIKNSPNVGEFIRSYCITPVQVKISNFDAFDCLSHSNFVAENSKIHSASQRSPEKHS